MNQSAIANPILLSEHKPPFAPVVRQFPDATCPFLRFQVGVNVDRAMLEPRFEGKSVVGEFKNGRRISVFKLIGFGETLEAAQSMASKKSKASPILSASSPVGDVLPMGSNP